MTMVAQQQITNEVKCNRTVGGLWDEIRPYSRSITTTIQSYLPDGRPLIAGDATGLPSGSFKERGAVAKMREVYGEGHRDVVTASAGNFAAGVALGARALGMNAEVFVPIGTPEVKKQNIMRLGAGAVRVRELAETFEESRMMAQEYADEYDSVMVEPFDDEMVALGQGTIAYELLKKHPSIEHLLVPAGGGGLAAGCIEAIRQAGLRAKVYGVKLRSEQELCEGANVVELGTVARRTIEHNKELWGGLLLVDPIDVGQRVAEEDAVRAEHAEAMGGVAYDRYPEATALLGAAAAHRYFASMRGVIATIVTGSNADQTNLDRLHSHVTNNRITTPSRKMWIASGEQLRGR